jgi:spore photoproduct lyase
MIAYEPELIVVNEDYEQSEITQNVLSFYPNVPIKIIPNRTNEENLALSQNSGRKVMLLTEHRGKFFKLCPAYGECYTCCNMYTLNLTQNCHFACSYCFLQEYMNKHVMTQFVNLEALFSEMDQMFLKRPDIFFRISTGELADSLALDDATGLNKALIKYFSKQNNAVLEFRTKSSDIDHLLNIKGHKNTVISWSIGSDLIQKEEEHKTATQLERIKSAAKAARAGYGIAFHFDPMIYFEGYEKEYAQTIQSIKDYVPLDSILWISMGTLRFALAQRHAMRENFPNSKLLQGELLTHSDGKMRYPVSQRVEMYKWLHQQVENLNPKIMQYLCMEEAEVWEKVFAHKPGMTNAKVMAEISQKAKDFFNKVPA